MEASTAGNIRNAMHSATYNMVVQIVFRLTTFLLNGLVLRYTTRDVLGVVNVRLTLLYSSVLFLSREAFRKACLSRYHNDARRWKQTINLLCICTPFGAIVSALLAMAWMYFLELPESHLGMQYAVSVIVFALCATFELLAEPTWFVAQSCQFIKLKVVAEGAALASKCLVTCILIIRHSDLGLYVFCIAQSVHAVVYVLVYVGFFVYNIKWKDPTDKSNIFNDRTFPFQSVSDMLPSFGIIPVLSFSQLRLTLSFLKQSFLKQFLTEGERYIMTFFSVLTFAEQGLFDVVNNLGSLAARFLFLPLEESFYILFSQTLLRGQPACKQPPEAVEQSSSSLQGVLKCVSLVGAVILVFGQSYSFLLLDMYGGNILSSDEGPLLLRLYCLYVLVIAINGITECFMFACMSKSEVDRYNYAMLGFTAAFLVSSLLLTKWLGSVGFIVANCLNMGLRIGHSVMFILQFFGPTPHRPLRGVIPSIPVCVALLLSLAVTLLSSHTFCCNQGWYYRLVHIGIGGCCLLLVAAAVLLTEKQFIAFLRQHLLTSDKKLKMK